MHMKLNNRTKNCAECEYMRTYDYGNKIYYCDHADRIDDMGKLSVGDMPKISPEWCPLRCKSNNNSSDLIKMQSDIHLTDKEGNSIEVKSIQPECLDRV